MAKVTFKQAFKRASLRAKKASPAMLIAAGCVGVVGATILACKQTLEVAKIIDKNADRKEVIEKERREKTLEEYTNEEYMNDLRTVKKDTIKKIAKSYAVPAAIETVSIASIIFSHRMMSKRNAGLAAALTASTAYINEYKKAVADKIGTTAEKQIRTGEEIVTEKKEDGTETIKVQKSRSGGHNSPYAKIFEEGNPAWTPDSSMNMLWLRSIEREMNHKLRMEGILFLNDVYSALNIPKTSAGQIVGWVYEKGNGDNYVDFGLDDIRVDEVRDFINSNDPNDNWVTLDFNVDGVIYDLIP